MNKNIHDSGKIDIKELLKKRRDFYLEELIYSKESEEIIDKHIKKDMVKSKIKKKDLSDISFKFGAITYFKLIHEMELLYSILYQLIEYLEKDKVKLEILEKETDFYSNEGIRWVLQDLERGLTETVKEKIDFGDDIE